MIERVTVDGREGFATWVDDGFRPLPRDDANASLIKIVFEDGGQLILSAQEAPAAPQAKAAAGKEQWPRDGESRDAFMQRCSAGLLAGGMSADKAREVCAAKWADVQRARAFDPDQPRDEHGRWSETGAGEAGGGESASELREPEEASVDQIIDAVPGARIKDAAARAKLADGIPTNAPVEYGGFKRADGSWTPERAVVHREIMTTILSPEKVVAATPRPGEQPVVHLIGGRGGSGKGWFTGRHGTIDRSKTIYLNNDDVKAALPEYEGWNAALLHQESSEIGNAIETAAMARGLNIVIDGTMRQPQSLAKRVAAYQDAGYRVVGHYMYASPATATRRALERFVRGGKTGRYVAPEYTLGSTTNEASFDAMRSAMDAWEVFDNSGKSPKLHARSK